MQFLRNEAEQEARKLLDDILRRRVIVTPDVERIIRALVGYLDRSPKK
jgi:hypothetical protein